MEDLKSLGDKPELKLGNKEVAFLVGAIFVMMVVVFGLGMMVGNRLYSQQPIPMAMTTPPARVEPVVVPAKPAATETEAEPEATGEDYTFYNLKKGDKAQPAGTPTGKKKKPGAEGSDTTTPATTPEPKTKPTKKEKVWTIQAGAFLTRSNSAKEVEKLRNKGVNAWIQRVAPKKAGNIYYSICAGKYRSYDKARQDMENYKAARLIPQDSYIRKIRR